MIICEGLDSLRLDSFLYSKSQRDCEEGPKDCYAVFEEATGKDVSRHSGALQTDIP